MVKKIVLLVVGLLIAVSAFAASPELLDKIVCSINGTSVITEATLDQQIALARRDPELAHLSAAQLRKAVLDQLIGNALLLQGAKEHGVTLAPGEVDQAILKTAEARYQGLPAQLSLDEQSALLDNFYRALAHQGLTKEDIQRQLRDQLLISKWVTGMKAFQDIAKAQPTPAQAKEAIKIYREEHPAVAKPVTYALKLYQKGGVQPTVPAVFTLQELQPPVRAVVQNLQPGQVGAVPNSSTMVQLVSVNTPPPVSESLPSDAVIKKIVDEQEQAAFQQQLVMSLRESATIDMKE